MNKLLLLAFAATIFLAAAWADRATDQIAQEIRIKEVVRRSFDRLKNEHLESVLRDLFASDVVIELPPSRRYKGEEALTQYIRDLDIGTLLTAPVEYCSFREPQHRKPPHFPHICICFPLGWLRFVAVACLSAPRNICLGYDQMQLSLAHKHLSFLLFLFCSNPQSQSYDAYQCLKQSCSLH
jgi:hypothetical protein